MIMKHDELPSTNTKMGGGFKRRNASQLKKKKKKKKRANNSDKNDWYTNDEFVGIHGMKKNKRREAKSMAMDDSEWAEESKALKNSDKHVIDVYSASSESEDDDEDLKNDSYCALLKGLNESLEDDKMKSKLLQIQREQEGIEDYSSDDEENPNNNSAIDDDTSNSEEEAEEEEEEEVEEEEEEETEETGEEDPEESGSTENDDSENSQSSVSSYDDDAHDDVSDSGANMDDMSHDNLDNEEESSAFRKRFVQMYGMSEDDAEKTAECVDTPQIKKQSIQLSNESIVLSHHGRDQNDLCIAKFKSAAIEVDHRTSLENQGYLKSRLARRWLAYAQRRQKIACRRIGVTRVSERNADGLTRLQSALVTPVMEYSDIVFSSRSLTNASELRELYILQALNHVFTSRDIIASHNTKIQQRRLSQRQRKEHAVVTGTKFETTSSERQEEEIFSESIRDQGLTRPTVLFVVPNRIAALRIVRLIIELMPDKANISNKARFFKEFTEATEEEEDGGQPPPRVKRERCDASESYDELYYATNSHPGVQEYESTHKGGPRPADWLDTFDGNNDECFKIGIAINGRKSMKIYSDFYKSDILIGSPLGLRMATNQEIGETDFEEVEESHSEGDDDDDRLRELGVHANHENKRNMKRKKGVDIDFLSSIEVCVVDQADVLEMQNWQHLVDLMAVVNTKPMNVRDEMDFSRVRHSFLLKRMPRRLRQTLVFTRYPSPYINALFIPREINKLNLSGLISWRPASYEGVLDEVLVDTLSHKFVRVEGDDNERLDFFERMLMKSFKSEAAAHTMVVIPSYFDFVHVRNQFRKVAESLGESGNRAQGKGFEKVKNTKRKKRGDDDMGTVGNDSSLYVCCSEYTDSAQVTRCRGDFFRGQARIFLTTERFHFYNRYRIRGIHRIVCYAPLEHPEFYRELCNLIESTEKVTNVTLFSKQDALALERVVGSDSVKQMCLSEKSVFNFE